MPSSRGRRLPLSLPRRLVADLMRACQGIPAVTAERRFHLADLAASRRESLSKPAWSALFARAFALVAADMPALRRSYFRFPWPHLHEHPESVGVIAVEREYQGEEAVLFAQLRQPEACPLGELDAQLRQSQTAPLESVPSFRRTLRLGRMPWPLRGWMLRLGLHGSGRLREKHFGTFVLSSPAAQGAGMVNLICPVTAALHYGLLDDEGGIDVRLTFDHRVLDGATAARALSAMEAIMHGRLLDEIRDRSPSTGRAA